MNVQAIRYADESHRKVSLQNGDYIEYKDFENITEKYFQFLPILDPSKISPEVGKFETNISKQSIKPFVIPR